MPFCPTLWADDPQDSHTQDAAPIRVAWASLMPISRLTKRRMAAGLAIVAALLLIGLWLLQPQRSGPFLMRQIGNAVALQITAHRFDYHFHHGLQLEWSDLRVRQPGEPHDLLRVKHAFIALPWRTLRSMGDDLTLQRIELDTPILQLPALQRWLATRPPSKTRLPTITQGLQLRNGRIDNDDWQLRQLNVNFATLAPQQTSTLHVQGRYHAAPMEIPADLQLQLPPLQALLDGTPGTLVAQGRLTIAGNDWRLPAHVILRGPLQLGKDSALMRPVKLGLAGQLHSGATRTQIHLGAYGPMTFNNASWRFAPATFVLQEADSLPALRAHGSASIGETLRLQLQGEIPHWPSTWPTLPAPLAASRSVLAFRLDYRGALAFTDTAALTLRRDTTHLDTQFALPALLTWLDARNTGTPLPPIIGTLTTPRLELDSTTLEGVEVELSESSAAASAQ